MEIGPYERKKVTRMEINFMTRSRGDRIQKSVAARKRRRTIKNAIATRIEHLFAKGRRFRRKTQKAKKSS